MWKLISIECYKIYNYVLYIEIEISKKKIQFKKWDFELFLFIDIFVLKYKRKQIK
jgi:hypothetical protein